MKKYFIKASFSLLVAVIGLSSCLKEKPIFDPANSVTLVELGDPSPISEYASTGFIYNTYNNSFDIKNTPTVFTIPVKYSGGQAAPQDIVVTLELNNSIIDKYNTYHGYASSANASFAVPLGTAAYTVPSYTVTIPKGQSMGSFTVNLNTNQFSFANQLALGFTIKSVTGGAPISTNFGTCLYIVGAKNAYDGVYAHTYTSTLGNGSNTVTMKTIGANTVTYGLLGVYSNVQNLTVDPATNKVTVSMTTLLPIATDPSSVYDPATKTFTIKYTSNGGARTFSETFKYTGPR